MPPNSKIKFKRRKKKNSLKFSVKIKIFLILITLVGIIIFLDYRTRPAIKDMCQIQLCEYASEQISDSVNKAISELGYNYSDYVTIQTNEDGKITSIHTNAKQISNILNAVSSNVNKSFDNFKSIDVDLNIGSISGIGWFLGRGFTIPIKITTRGSATAEIISKLEEAGINQTFHKIHIKVTADLIGIFPGYSVKTTSSSICLISESLIVGTVPQCYATLN